MLSLIGAEPAALVLSILGLRRAADTGSGCRMAIAGIAISSVSMAIVVITLLSVLNPSDPPAGAEALPQPTGTTVTVNPAVAELPSEASAPAATTAQVAALASDPRKIRGETFVLTGTTEQSVDESSALTAEVHAGKASAKVLLRGTLLDDATEDDDFHATVTVTAETAHGLPILTVSALDLS